MLGVRFNNSAKTYREYYLKRNKKLTDHDRRFLDWMDRVEEIVVNKIGLYLIDMTDMLYYDLFDEGLEPQFVANEMISQMNDSIIYLCKHK